MIRVSLNRLKNEATHLSSLITALDQQGTLVQDLFNSIYKLCNNDKDGAKESIDGAPLKRNTKEVLKLVVTLMIEDIWSNFENYKLQSQVVHRLQQQMFSQPLQLEKPELNFSKQVEQFEQTQKVVELRRQSNSMKSSQCSRANEGGNRKKGRYQTVVTTDDEQPYSHKQKKAQLFDRINEPTASLDSPADLAQSELETENPLLNRDLSLNTTNQINPGKKLSRQQSIKESQSIQIDPKEFELLLRKNIQEFESNANFKDLSDHSISSEKGPNHFQTI